MRKRKVKAGSQPPVACREQKQHTLKLEQQENITKGDCWIAVIESASQCF